MFRFKPSWFYFNFVAIIKIKIKAGLNYLKIKMKNYLKSY
jgi:hypothetical protein